mgnify:FL=1|jgi:hypothetical protein
MVTVEPRELDWDPDGPDNWWLVALEQAYGDLPVVEPSAFDEPLTDDQKDILDNYEQAYEGVMNAYELLVKSFGYKPKFG